MQARLVRGCIAMAFTARVGAVACSHLIADAVKGGELSYMALMTMEREQSAYRSVLPLAGALPADPQPSPLRLLRGCIAMPFTAGVRAVASRAGTAWLMPSRAASSATWH